MFNWVVLRIDSLEGPEVAPAVEHSRHESQELAEAFRDHLNDQVWPSFPYYVSAAASTWDRIQAQRAR